jgi:hypothetical protein
MERRLTLHRIAPVRDRALPVAYEVGGLPQNEDVMILNVGSAWRVMRAKNGVRRSWTEGFASAEDALASVQADVDRGDA